MLTIDPNSQPVDQSKIEGIGSRVSYQPTSDNIVPDLDTTGEDELQKLEKEVQLSQDELDNKAFLDRSIQAFESSDQYFNTNIRPRLDDSVKAYNNRHSANSAMGFDGNPQNNKIYRPKTRTIINNYKAACAASFFTNLDVVSIEPENPSDKTEVISASIIKSLLNYRLRKFIPWYNICVGAFDDALVQGLCVAYCYWDVKIKRDGTIKEKPSIDVVPLENFRFDPAADWSNIIDSSPYLIMLTPTYIGDLLDAMKQGIFNGCAISKTLSASDISASWQMNNTTAQERNPNNVDPNDSRPQAIKPNDYQSVVVQLHIHRIGGEDWLWYTLNNTHMLTDPMPLEEVHLHGQRPFIIGSADIEPHRAFVTPFPEEVACLQDEMNILANQRRTNVDMALNRKFRVSPEAGDSFDPKALLSNEVGAIVFGEKDSIEALTVADVTQSSYQEQALLDKDFDNLSGNFNPTGLTQKNNNDAYKTNQMLNSQANMILDGKLKCFAFTFVEPLLRLLVKLEQTYETDDVIVALAGMQAGLFMKNYRGGMEWSDKASQIMGPPPQEFIDDFHQQQQQPQPAPEGGQPPQAGAPQPPPAPVPAGGPPPQAGAPPQPGAAPQGPPQGGQSPQGQQNPQGVKATPSTSALPPGIDIRNLLKKELVINVNVGLNATAPDDKLKRLMAAFNTVLNLSANPFHTMLDLEEASKEIFALSGYGDGKRFMNQQINPQVAVMQQTIMQLQKKLQDKMGLEQLRVQGQATVATIRTKSQEKIEAAKIEHSNKELKQEGAIAVLDHKEAMSKTNGSQD